jgi:hypothetical protein
MNRFIESSPASVHGGVETPWSTEAADANGEHFLNLSGVQSGCKQIAAGHPEESAGQASMGNRVRVFQNMGTGRRQEERRKAPSCRHRFRIRRTTGG